MPLDFELEAPAFDLDNAYLFARACEVFNKKDELFQKEAVNELGLTEDSIQSFHVVRDEEEVADFHAFIGTRTLTDEEGQTLGEIAMLVFRDVDNIEPWLKESMMAQKAGYGGMVHKGFSDALEQLCHEADLESALTGLVKGKPLWIAGHGLGGAMAVLMAAKLHEKNLDLKEVYTFGCPRVGNTEFYFKYPVRTYRVVNNNDIIAHVPAEQVIVGGFRYYEYTHVGTLKYFDRHGQYGEGMSNWACKQELIRNRLAQVGEPPSQWFEDHHITSYVTAIRTSLY